MSKTGWWSINFDITLDGKEVCFDDLSESAQEHILYLIMNGHRHGEVVEEG